jgi:hypothetical protein
VLFVTEGLGKSSLGAEMGAGSAFFLPAGESVQVSGEVVIYRTTKRGSVAHASKI